MPCQKGDGMTVGENPFSLSVNCLRHATEPNSCTIFSYLSPYSQLRVRTKPSRHNDFVSSRVWGVASRLHGNFDSTSRIDTHERCN